MEAFYPAVNLLNRFLSEMKVEPKHIECVGLSSFYLAAKSVEEQRSVSLASDLIQIISIVHGSDFMRMEKTVLGKVCWEVKAPTAFQFLQLCYKFFQKNSPFKRKNSLKFERLETLSLRHITAESYFLKQSFLRWPIYHCYVKT